MPLFIASYVNDAVFWMFKEFHSLTLKETFTMFDFSPKSIIKTAR
ncbi:hypothetical protein [Sporosarcina sp. BP05]|nr:hypothetical protein [Sporosarcina sp. BP05]